MNFDDNNYSLMLPNIIRDQNFLEFPKINGANINRYKIDVCRPNKEDKGLSTNNNFQIKFGIIYSLLAQKIKED